MYRGVALGPSFAGRYYFADFVTQRIWSIAITTNGAGSAVAGDLREHTADLGAVGGISAFGTDASQEIYLVNHSGGQIRRLVTALPLVALDGVVASSSGLELSGWAIDRRAPTGPGVDSVHVYTYPAAGGAPVFMGAWSAPFLSRPDVAALYGAQ